MNLKITFTCKNLYQQKFSFSQKIFDYILENVIAGTMRKLYQTCKYFYFKVPYFIVDIIDFSEKKISVELEEIDECIDVYNLEDLVLFDNIWLTQEVKGCSEFHFNMFFNSKIVCYDMRKISFLNTSMSMDKFKILTNSSKVEELMLYYSPVLFSDGTEAPLEDILKCVPNAVSIQIRGCHITHETMENLNLIPWKQYFHEVLLCELDNLIDVGSFCNFILDNIEGDGEIVIQYGDGQAIFCYHFVDQSLSKQNSIEPTDMNEDESNFTICTIKRGLPPTIINYIILAANSDTMKKLYKICKYFYKKSPFLITKSVEFYTKIFIDDHFIDEKAFENYNNFWVTEDFECISYDKVNQIVSKIIRCDAENICLRNSAPLLQENFKTLTKRGKVKYCFLKNTLIINERGNVSLENILACLLNVEKFGYSPCHVTPETLKKLLSFPWKNKIQELWLMVIDIPFNVTLFIKFLQKALAPRAEVIVHFKDFQNDEQSRLVFVRALKKEIHTLWKPKKARPTFKVLAGEDFVNY